MIHSRVVKAGCEIAFATIANEKLLCRVKDQSAHRWHHHKINKEGPANDAFGVPQYK